MDTLVAYGAAVFAVFAENTHRGNTVVRAMLAAIVIRGGYQQFGLLGWTRFHVGHGGSRPRLAYTTLPSHAFHAASREHRRFAAAASSCNPYLYWECEENRHKGVHFAQQRVNGSGVVGYRSGQTQVLPAGRYTRRRAISASLRRACLHESDDDDDERSSVSRARSTESPGIRGSSRRVNLRCYELPENRHLVCISENSARKRFYPVIKSSRESRSFSNALGKSHVYYDRKSNQ